MLSEAVDCSGD